MAGMESYDRGGTQLSEAEDLDRALWLFIGAKCLISTIFALQLLPQTKLRHHGTYREESSVMVITKGIQAS
jgi:hypothetical protein